MAAIRRREGKRGVTYDVQIRIRPYPPTTATFKKLTDAKRWAEKTEMEMREGRYGMITESRKKTLSEAIERYCKYVLPEIKKSRREHIIAWWEKTLGHLSLKDLHPSLFVEIRDKLLHEDIEGKKRAPATVVKYLATISHILSICIEWQWLETNPLSKISKPSLPKGRTRFLDENERRALLFKCEESKNPYLYIIVILGIATGMRRSEILNLTWPDVDFERDRIVLKETKNGEVRILPLVGFVKDLLNELKKTREIISPFLFPGKDPSRPIDFRSAWEVAVRGAGLNDFKFHDLRHSFASYCVMNGSSLNEVADLLGHKGGLQSITRRYCHLSDAYRKDVVASMNEKVFKLERGK